MAERAFSTARPRLRAPQPSPLHLRQLLEQTIERLIALLDDLDGDPDQEPDADGEPWLAGTGGGFLTVDLELDPSDAEPWLGRLETFAQGIGSWGGDRDLEYDPAELACGGTF